MPMSKSNHIWLFFSQHIPETKHSFMTLLVYAFLKTQNKMPWQQSSHYNDVHSRNIFKATAFCSSS